MTVVTFYVFGELSVHKLHYEFLELYFQMLRLSPSSSLQV